MIDIKPPCIVFGEKVLPAIRKEIATILVNEKNYSQARTAKLLGITQAMVSKYIASGGGRIEGILQKEIKKFSQEIIETLDNSGEATLELCLFCLKLREEAKLCDMHKTLIGDTECKACMKLRTKDNPRNKVIRVLERAIDILKEENISNLMPEVRINMAMCTPFPRGPFDVASIPGRLIVVGSGIICPKEPEFNASRHTTNLLLEINSLQPMICAVMNIKYFKNMERIIAELGFKTKILERKGNNLIIEKIDKGTDCMIDRGGFGIEPCVYVVGKDAIDISRKAVQISKVLKR
ncbi:MAG: thiamine-phosphate synthase family protein [Candidatus Methanofastidiosia archaeon]